MNHSLDILSALTPEIILAAGAFLVLALDVVLWRAQSVAVRIRRCALVSVLVCLASVGVLVLKHPTGASNEILLTGAGQTAKVFLLVLAGATAAISADAKFTRHAGEFFSLLLFCLVGLMLLLSTDNLLLLFVALELAGLPLYILTAFNRTSAQSAEAALKFFLFGGVAAAFTLFGISLCYGISGDISLPAIAMAAVNHASFTLTLAMIMTLAGFVFKVAAAPFHFWAPDTYEAAPAPVAAFVASASKVGAFIVLARIVLVGFGTLHGSAVWGSWIPGWMPLLAIVAMASVLLGNLAALIQTRVRRLLAYSAVANAGYALLGFYGNGSDAMSSLLFYVFTYAATVLGAFAVVFVVENGGVGDRLQDWAGLRRRAPLLSVCMFVFMLSLAGVPPLAGFFGKFYLFTTAAQGAPRLGLLWLVVVAIAASVISLYYYLQVLKQIWVAEPPSHAPVVVTSLPAMVAILGLAALVVALGCLPQWFLNTFQL